MSLKTPQYIAAYRSELEESCPMGKVRIWKTIKGLIWALLAWVGAYIAVQFGAEPTPIYLFAGFLSVVFFTGEVKEIEIASAITATFDDHRNRNARSEPDDTDE